MDQARHEVNGIQYIAVESGCGVDAAFQEGLMSKLVGWQKDGRKALVPYVTAGFPYADITPELMHGMVEAGAGQCFGGQGAGGEPRDGLRRGQLVWRGHARSPRWRSTHSPVASSLVSAWRFPTSWMPTGNPSGPVPAGNVRQGM